MKQPLTLLLFLSIILSQACQSGNTDSQAADATAQNAENAEPDTYIVTVENLRLRETPSLKGKVITTIKEGAELTYLKERSEHKDTATLRGVKYEEPWYKVKTAEGKTGWAFGGAIRAVHKTGSSTSDATGLDEAALAALLTSIQKANFNDLKAASALIASIKADLPKVSKGQGDQIFWAFYDYLQNCSSKELVKFYDRNPLSNDQYNKIMDAVYTRGNGKMGPDMNTNDYTKSLAAAGITFGAAEGSLFLQEDPDFLINTFNAYVSPEVQKWLEGNRVEVLVPAAEDGGLTIEPADLVKRLEFWDNFLETYPNAKKSDDAKFIRESYLRSLFAGMDNTPAFDYDTQEILPEYKKLIQDLAKQNSVSGRAAAAYVKVMQANNWKRTDKVNDYLAREKFVAE